MELHDHLYALGLRMGRDVFDDADGFRGALDDFLDEEAATTGDINLLVDAVRLGAFRSMLTTLESGGDVARAVEEAGARLARDRGSVDVAGARWACAVLGFAVGRVSDPDVRRYRTAHPPQGPGGAATVLPTPPPSSPSSSPPTAVPQGFPPPVQQPPPYAAHQPPPPAAATAVPGAAGQPPLHVSPPQQFGAPGPAGWASPTPPKRKTWPIVVAVVAVLAVVGGVGGTYLLTAGDDDADKKVVQSDGPTSETTTEPVSSGPTTEPTDEVTELGTDFASVNDRYSGLARLVTTGVDSCSAVATMSGQVEHLECGFANGTLTLVTYGSASELRAGRTRAVTYESGGVFEESASGTIMGYEEEDDDALPTKAFLYWDAEASLQSAQYDATRGTDLDDLVKTFTSTDPSLKYPTGPSSPELVDFAAQWFLTSKCTRIETIIDNELEENYCDVNGPVEVYLGRFKSFADLRAYRKLALANAKADKRELRTWNQQEGDPPEGSLYEYTTDAGSAVRYWDQPDCLCYAEAFLSNGSYEQLKNWWYTG